jgi:PPOX class probable F420-dependent enzyme
MYGRAMVALTACAEQKLTSDVVAWLTTIRPDGSPATRPVWFVWHEPDLFVYSEPHTHKVRHLTRDPRGSVHFNSDDEGGSIVVLDVDAAVDHDAAKPSTCPGYLAKYRASIDRLGVTVDAYDRQFSTLLRLVVRRCIDTRDTLGSD